MRKFSTIKISKKFKYLLIIIGILFIASISIPTLSRYKNRTNYYQVVEWDGTIASEYRSGSGSIDNPYVISNGQEFAFFVENLKTTNYEGVYFKLNNDIVLNKGLFSYDEANIKYKYEDETYYINEFNVNKISMIDTFNGNLDGNGFKIYGLFIDSNLEEVSLFKNLNGNVNNLYIENSVINGGVISSGLAINSNNANIKNVLYDGYLISSSSNNVDTYDLDDTISDVDGVIDLSSILINGNIISSTLTGVYSKSGEIEEFKINDQVIEEGNFSITLGNTKDNINYSISGIGQITLSNLKYSVTTDYKVASGLIVNANNTSLENVVNSIDVYTSGIASGLIFNASDTISLKNSYNKGNITSKLSTGLINEIDGNINITNCYNSGNLNSSESYSFINSINNNSQVTITNSFSIYGTYGINRIDSLSTVTINNSYITHNSSVKESSNEISFISTSESNFKNSSFVKNTLGFSEYVNLENALISDNVWVITNNEYPILYIDDLNNPIAKINVSMFSWNNLSNDLNTLKFSNKFIFSITSGSEISSIKKIYYYIHNSDVSLSSEELENIEWIEYSNIVEVNTSGKYIIYAKIVDSDDKTTYINSDILSIDLDTSIIKAIIGNNEFSSFNIPSNYLYINESTKVSVSVNEEYTKLEKVSYYISDIALSEEEIIALDNSLWTKYEEFNISSQTPKIIYFRVKDNTDYYSYINTDYIILKGYSQSDLTVGRNIFTGNNLNITNNSSIKFNTKFIDDNEFTSELKHVLISNTKLPENTKFTLIDNNTNKVYTYILTSDDYGYSTNNISTYLLSNFIEVGSIDDKYFKDSDYIGKINEDFDVIIDFSNTQLTNNYKDINIYMSVIDDNNIKITTLKDNIKSFNIYDNYNENDVKANISLEINYNNTINYNQDYLNIIPYELKLNYFSLDDLTIYDSEYEDMKYGLEISLYNKTTSSVMNKKYLNNVKFMIDDTSYHPNSKGIVNIDLDNNLIGNLNIQTYTDNFDIEDGEYVFKVCPYLSYDGINYNESNNNGCKLIPLIIDGNLKKEFNFDVIMNNENRVINKNGVQTLEFDILQMSRLDNPNVRVSLYKKRELTAYNQSYDLVNIVDYISGEVELYSENTIYALKQAPYNTDYTKFELLLDTDKLDLNGYKLIFELYDGDKLVTLVDQKFIVRGGS